MKILRVFKSGKGKSFFERGELPIQRTVDQLVFEQLEWSTEDIDMCGRTKVFLIQNSAVNAIGFAIQWFQKAFDSIDHAIFLQQKLCNCGFTEPIFLILRKYVSLRWQYVSNGLQTSSVLPMTFDVPQGPILGSFFHMHQWFTFYSSSRTALSTVRRQNVSFINSEWNWSGCKVVFIQKTHIKCNTLKESRLAAKKVNYENINCGRPLCNYLDVLSDPELNLGERNKICGWIH